MRVRTMEDVIRDDYRRIYKKEWTAEGWAKGLAEGMEKGAAKVRAEADAEIRKEKTNTVKGLLEEGIPVSVIQKVTKLSVAAINRIAQSLQTSAAPTAAA